jgi:hypothetical protein
MMYLFELFYFIKHESRIFFLFTQRNRDGEFELMTSALLDVVYS